VAQKKGGRARPRTKRGVNLSSSGVRYRTTTKRRKRKERHKKFVTDASGSKNALQGGWESQSKCLRKGKKGTARHRPLKKRLDPSGAGAVRRRERNRSVLGIQRGKETKRRRTERKKKRYGHGGEKMRAQMLERNDSTAVKPTAVRGARWRGGGAETAGRWTEKSAEQWKGAQVKTEGASSRNGGSQRGIASCKVMSEYGGGK